MSAVLNGRARVTRPREAAPELVMALRTPLPERCPVCGFGGIVRIVVERGGAPYRPGDVEYCACTFGSRRRRLDERDCADYYGAQDAAYVKTWERTLGLEGRMREWSLASFPRAKAGQYYVWAQNYVQKWDARRNLVLHGAPGVGKTGLMVSMVHEIRPRLIRAHYGARFVVAPDMFDDLRTGFDEHDFDARLEAFKTCHLLILDDLGTEMGTNFESKRLIQILNARYNAELPTWITSNLDLTPAGTGQLAAWLGGRITSRILERGDVVAMKGRDLRLT